MTAQMHVTLLTTILHAKSLQGGDEAVYDALRVVIGMHRPEPVQGATCESHFWGETRWDKCPNCTPRQWLRCSCSERTKYPCLTLRKIADVFGSIKHPGEAS